MRGFLTRVLALACAVAAAAGFMSAPLQVVETAGADAIPWGAMYVPIEVMAAFGMTGTIGYYRGAAGASALIADLGMARSGGVRLIATLGDVKPSTYADPQGRLDMAAVRGELAPFAAVAAELRPFVEDGTLWGIRFMDEPHDPSGLPQGVSVHTGDLGQVMAYLKDTLGPVRVGSTAPARYMVNVPGADWCFGQYSHDTMQRHGLEPVPYIEDDAALAEGKGMEYVASLNASTNPVGNWVFFEVYLALAALPGVDFLTSWQWPQGRYPNSFEMRISDPSVRALVEQIPEACRRGAV